MEDTAINLLDLDVHAAQAEAVTWQGREGLRLENGLALVPGCRRSWDSIRKRGGQGPCTQEF